VSYTKSTALRQIRQMDAYQFENLVADIYRKYNWDVSVTPSSTDRGVDIIATQSYPFEQKVLIQTKRYAERNHVGGPEVRKYASLRQQEGGDIVVLVTSSSFTQQANEIANQLNVKLINGSQLFETITNIGSHDLLKDYIHNKQEPNKIEKSLSKEEKLKKIKKSLPHTANDDIERDFVTPVDSDDYRVKNSGTNDSAIKYINDTETVRLYWKEGLGVGLTEENKRLIPGSGRQNSLFIITSEHLIIIVEKREQDKHIKIPLSDIQEVIPQRNLNTSSRSRFKDDIKVVLFNKIEVDWFNYSFDTIRFTPKLSNRVKPRVIYWLRNDTFVCEECDSEVTEYQKAEGLNVCKKCFNRSSL